MRVAFVAKGGSGKTTLSSLFIRYVLNQGKNVTAIDGDMNQHLATALNLSDAVNDVQDLGNNASKLSEILAAKRTDIENSDQMIESTPPAKGSHIFTSETPSPVWDEFSYSQGSLKFLTAGAFKNSNMAATCYHEYTGAVTMFLNHYIDTSDEYVVADMTAGSDPYTSGMFSRFDVIIVALEPTLKSISIYDQCLQYGKDYNIPLFVVANKIEDTDDLEFVQNKVGDNLIAHMSFSKFVKEQERGKYKDISLLEQPNLDALQKIMDKIQSIPKDWDKYQSTGEAFHKIKAEGWGNIFCGTDLSKQVDSKFSYKETAISLGAL